MGRKGEEGGYVCVGDSGRGRERPQQMFCSYVKDEKGMCGGSLHVCTVREMS